MLTSPEILVPVDFSPCSVNALRVAIGMAAPEGDLTLLHVIDQEFIDDAVAAGLGLAEDIRVRLRERAETSFSTMFGKCRANDCRRLAVRGDSEDCARSRSAYDCNGCERTFYAAGRNSVWLDG